MCSKPKVPPQSPPPPPPPAPTETATAVTPSANRAKAGQAARLGRSALRIQRNDSAAGLRVPNSGLGLNA